MATANEVSTDAAPFVPSPVQSGRPSNGYAVTPPSTHQVSPDYGPSGRGKPQRERLLDGIRVDARQFPRPSPCEGRALQRQVSLEALSGWQVSKLGRETQMFMLQACRGNECGKIVNVRGGVHVDSGPVDDEEEIEYKIPSHADFLMAYSTVEGQVCFRDPIKGSWFIQTLWEKLSMPNMTLTYDFVRILTRTNKRIAVGNSECEAFMNVTHCRMMADVDHPAATAVVTNKMAEDGAGRRWYHVEWCCLGKRKEKVDMQVHRLTRQAPAFNSTLTREVYFRPKTVITDVEAITD